MSGVSRFLRGEPAPALKLGVCCGCGAELLAGLISGLCDACDVDLAF